MEQYADKETFINEIKKTATLFIKEFDDVAESDKNLIIEGIDRTPEEIIAYQLGWMQLLKSWESDELAGKEVITPDKDFKWNQLGKLYERFYAKYNDYSLSELKEIYISNVEDIILWIKGFDEDQLFNPGGRKWAESTPSNWPVWKWIHINTVAPFKSFRSKIRKWKKLRAAQV